MSELVKDRLHFVMGERAGLPGVGAVRFCKSIQGEVRGLIAIGFRGAEVIHPAPPRLLARGCQSA